MLAQSGPYPNRTIKIIVPYSAGTGSDILARTVGQSIAEKTKQSVVIENREGGGSLVGTMEAAKAAPDGYTLLIVANPFAIVPTQKSPPPYDVIKDFVPIAKVAVIPLVLVAASAQPIEQHRGAGGLCQGEPGQAELCVLRSWHHQPAGDGDLQAGGGPGYRRSRLQEHGAGDDRRGRRAHSPVPGRGAARAAAHQGRTCEGAGRVRYTPVGAVAGVPSMSEAVKVPGYVPTPVWYGFVAPAGTPKDAVDTLNRSSWVRCKRLK